MNLPAIIISVCLIIIVLSLYQIFFEDSVNRIKFKRRGLYQKKSGVEFVRIKIKKKEVDYESIDNYFELTNKYLSKAKKSIKIVDYFSSHNVIMGLYNSRHECSDEQATYLKEKYGQYYNNLKDKILNNENITCTRIAQISGIYRKENLKQLEKRTERLISLMTPTLTSHLFDLLKIEKNRFEFYICDTPAVLYNYMIIDDKYVLSEYPLYSPEGITFPDEMYVNKYNFLSAQIKKRIKLVNVLKEHKTKVNYNLFYKAYEKFMGVGLKELENEKYNWKEVDKTLTELEVQEN
jgi:hypothetical protein